MSMFSNKFEKYTFIGMLLVLFALAGNSMYKINETGGLKASIIEAGKEVKDIMKEIKEH